MFKKKSFGCLVSKAFTMRPFSRFIKVINCLDFRGRDIPKKDSTGDWMLFHGPQVTHPGRHWWSICTTTQGCGLHETFQKWMPRYGTWKAAISTVFIQSLCLYNYTAYIYTTSTSTLAFTCFIWAFPHFDTNSTGGASLRSPTSWRSLVWYLYESPKALAQTLVVDFLG